MGLFKGKESGTAQHAIVCLCSTDFCMLQDCVQHTSILSQQQLLIICGTTQIYFGPHVEAATEHVTLDLHDIISISST